MRRPQAVKTLAMKIVVNPTIMLHSIKSISIVPSPKIMGLRFQSLAMLDAILMPDWEFRYFSFNSKWSANEMMASMRNGEGDEYFFLINSSGTIGKIFCHELNQTETSKQILEKVPHDFKSFLNEAAFKLQDVTCCLWQTASNPKWIVSPDMIGEIPLLGFIENNGEYYRGWATQYYERDIPVSIVESVFAHQPLTNELLSKLPEKRNMNDLIADASEIGYPYRTG